MPLFYFTFGQRYRRHPHPKLGMRAHPDGWVTIEAPDWEAARQRMFSIAGAEWANQYGEPPDRALFPRGELFRLRSDAKGNPVRFTLKTKTA